MQSCKMEHMHKSCFFVQRPPPHMQAFTPLTSLQPKFAQAKLLHHKVIGHSRKDQQVFHRISAEAPSSSSTTASSSGIVNYKDAELLPTRGDSAGPFPDQPGVYGMYDSEKVLQYIGLSRKVSLHFYCIHNLNPNLSFASARTSASHQRE